MSLGPKRIITEANMLLEKDDNRSIVASFLERFSQCEVYVRPSLKKYYGETGALFDADEFGVEATTIRMALSESGIYFDDNKLITRIFGSTSTKGKSSCRWLRNKITHELMKRAIKEVCERSVELMSDMESLIQQISEQL